MKRLIIICEGETEQELCSNMLRPYFVVKDIMVECPLIKKSMGGIVSWHALKSQILGHLAEHAYVTTFIDYYGIKDSYQYPCWTESKGIADKYERITLLESAMGTDVDSYKFIPYIQLHEYEALLFNNKDSFTNILPENELQDEAALIDVIAKFPNPELINDKLETSPSHRLKKIIPTYDKIIYGYCLAEEIGLDNIRAKCPHFDGWLEKLAKI